MLRSCFPQHSWASCALAAVASTAASLRPTVACAALVLLLAFVLGSATANAQATAHVSAAQSSIGGGFFDPQGVAVDASGNVYVADEGHYAVKEIPAGCLSTSCVVSIGGRFSLPIGVAVDFQGNVFVADNGSGSPKKIPVGCTTSACVVILGGGKYSLPGGGFEAPNGIAVDAGGNVYVTDTALNQVREIPSGCGTFSCTVRLPGTYAGPSSVTVDNDGNVYVTESRGQEVDVIPLGCSNSSCVYPVESGNPPFFHPDAVAVDAYGNLFVGDTGFSSVAEFDTYCQAYCQPQVGAGFSGIGGVALGANGAIYASSINGGLVEQLSPSGNFGNVNIGVTSATISIVFAFDTTGVSGSSSVLTQGATGLDFTSAGTGTCIPGQNYNAGQSCTVDVVFTPTQSGIRYGAVQLFDNAGNVIATGYVQGNGIGSQVAFNPPTQVIMATGLSSPSGVAVDATGSFYISNTGANDVVKTTHSGGAYSSSIITGPPNYFSSIAQIAVDGANNIFLTQPSTQTIFKIKLTSGVYAAQGLLIHGQYAQGIATDGAGNLYVADPTNGAIYMDSTEGGSSAANYGSGDAYATTTIVSQPVQGGVAVDGSGNVFFTGSSPIGVYEAAFTPYGYTVTMLPSAGMANPLGMAIDGNGNLYIADETNNVIYKETLSAGAYTLSVYPTGTLNHPTTVTLDGKGNLYINNQGANNIVEEVASAPPTIAFLSSTSHGTVDLLDGALSASIVNIGNTTLNFPALASGNNPSISPNFVLDSSTDADCQQAPSTLAPGASCLLSVTFEPLAAGSISGSILLTDDAMNAVAPAYATQTVTLTGTGAKTTPAITWPTPAAISYGTPLSAAQLNASSTVPGTFAYTPALGAVLSAGSQTLSVSFTPTDTANYTTNTQTASLTITPATPAVTWAAPASISYGTALGATQLNASSSVPGNYAYSPASGTVLAAGSTTLKVTFTPTDAVNYTSVGQSTSLTVSRATLTITASSPTLAYGASVPTITPAYSGFQNGDTASVVIAAAPTCSTTYTTTTKVNAIAPATSCLGATASSNYNPSYGNGAVTITQAQPAINWGPQAAIPYGTALSATQLNATSPVAGSFAYSPALGAVLAVGQHTLSVAFTPTDAVDYTAPTQTISLTIGKTIPTITWATPAAISYLTQLSAAQLNATASVAGALVYTPAAGAVLNGGSQTLSVTLTPTDSADYSPVTQTVSLTVNQDAQTLSFPAPASPVTFGSTTPITLTAAPGASGKPVTFSVLSGPGTVSGSILTLTGSGTIVVAADEAANTNYSAAPEVTHSIVVHGPGAILTPIAGIATILGPGNVPFTWTAGSGASEYQLWLGTTGVGSKDIYNSGGITATSATVPTIPSGGAMVYVRLYSELSGVWLSTDYVYTESGTTAPATLLSPTPGPTVALGTTFIPFTWSTGNGVTDYQLYLGTTGPGSRDLYSSGGTTATSIVVPSLPAGGIPIYATLLSEINGAWQSNNYLYIESGTPAPAQLSLPSPGAATILGSTNVQFSWTTGGGVSEYQFWLGSTGVGSKNLYNSGGTSATSVTLPSLPATGVTVYARLYSEILGVWQSTDYVYTEAPPPPAVITSPTAGLATILGASNIAFTWPVNAGITEYQLWLGTTGVGSKNLYNSGGILPSTATVATLPANGVTVYVRLYSLIAGVWYSTDSVYTETGTPAPAVLTSPTPGTATILGAAPVTFSWTTGTGPTEYILYLGSTGPGSKDLFNSGGTYATSITAPSLPATGATIYVRLYSEISGAWQYMDYTYTQ